MGRPTIYTEELSAEICALLSQGMSLRSVCRRDEMPDLSVIFDWIRRHKEFAQQYAQAKTESADALVEDMLDIADEAANIHGDGHDAARVNAARLRVDTRKWSASKLKPKKYGEKVDLDVSGSMQMKHEITKVENKTDAELLEILANKKITRENSQP